MFSRNRIGNRGVFELLLSVFCGLCVGGECYSNGECSGGSKQPSTHACIVCTCVSSHRVKSGQCVLPEANSWKLHPHIYNASERHKRQITIPTHSFLGQSRMLSYFHSHISGLGQKSEYPEKTHACSRRTWKIHDESCLDWIWIQNLDARHQ